jgi:hypothetical protein
LELQNWRFAIGSMATSVAGAWAFRRTGGGDGAPCVQEVHAVATAGNLGMTFQRMRSSMRDLIIETDPAEIIKYKTDLDAGRATLLTIMDTMHDSARSDAWKEKLTDDVDTRMKTYFLVADGMTELAMQNRNSEALRLLRADAVPAGRAFAASLTALMDAVGAQAQERAKANEKTAALGNVLLMANATSALLLAAVGLAACLLATAARLRSGPPQK